MHPKMIVMVTMLSMPNGDSGIQIKPFDTVSACVAAASQEVSDPLVAHVECAELGDDVLTLRVDQSATAGTPPSPVQGPVD